MKGFNTGAARAAIAAAFAAAALFARAAYEDVTCEKYPDADSVLVDATEDVEYSPDGTYRSRNENVVKILTDKGRRDEEVIVASYSARYGKAAITEVEVEGADGVRRKVDVSATTKETTDNSSTAHNIYDPMQRKIVCSVPGLKIGDTIRYVTEREVFNARVKNQFADISMMEWTCPIVRQTFRVKAPAELPIARVAVRNPIGNLKYSESKLDDGSTVHEWTAENSPQAFPEPDMPALSTQLQRIYVSTARDWREISRWYWELSVPHLEKTTKAITNRVDAILRTLPEGAGDLERIGAVYKWVAQEIRYMGLTMEDKSPGYAPHDVDITFDNRYGVCRDKAALLAAMLRIAGFDAYPVLIHAGAKMDGEVPLPYFNHAITAVRAPGAEGANADGFILMDATNESSRDIFPSYLGDRSYLVATPEGEGLHVSPVRPAAENSLAVAQTGMLERDGSLVMESEISFKGINDTAYRGSLLRKKPEERRRMFENILKSAAPGAELLSFEMWPKDLRETETALRVKIAYRAAGSRMRCETMDELSVPFLTRVFGVANGLLDGSTSLEKRRFPLQTASTAMTDETVEIDLAGCEGPRSTLPADVSIDGPYSFSRRYSVSGGKLSAKRTLALNTVEFSPEEYSRLLERLKEVEAAERARPLFALDRIDGANARWIRRETDCTVSSPHEWVVTNHVVKEILTYDGKKRSSELKFSYNPAWGDVKVVSAEVRSPGGETSRAGARETTLLDSSWAASAPRYPAGKTLVVNLPSVEIGSVIDYTVVTTVTNSPAPFRHVWMFDTTEPADFLAVRYRDWKGGAWERVVENPKVVKPEPMQPPAVLWRDCKIVSHGDFTEAAARLEPAANPDAIKSGTAWKEASAACSAADKIEAARNWMSKYVRVAGPDLYDVPLELQLSSPATVLEERYATVLDYMRTMCAILKGAGLDADVVFVADDTGDVPELVRMDREEFPDVAKYCKPVCRVVSRDGGFLGIGGERKTWFVGLENERTPVWCAKSAGCSYFDVSGGKPGFGKVANGPGAEKHGVDPAVSARYELTVRENGSVDVDYTREIRGCHVGGFRKTYLEMLPEDRSRHFMALLGGLSQSAVATRELSTDLDGYPGVLSYSAFIPSYATMSKSALSVRLPETGGRLFPLSGTLRETPVYTAGNDGEFVVETKVVFPPGWDRIEHLPESAIYSVPCAGGGVFMKVESSSGTDPETGRLFALVRETTCKRGPAMFEPACHALLQEYSRRSASRAASTVVAGRRGKSGKAGGKD